jgi:multimeric flavodoxin WrbA
MKAVCLLGTLKKSPIKSNTEEVVKEIFKILRRKKVKTKIIRLADHDIKHGLVTDMKDDWKKILKDIINSDIVIFATPIWWGQASSHIQKIIERLDGLDEEYIETGRQALKHKVAGIVITGHEDGAMHILGTLSSSLMWYGFCIPPEAAAYWVGEVGMPSDKDPQKRRRNKGTKGMIKGAAKSLYNYAEMISKNKELLKK